MHPHGSQGGVHEDRLVVVEAAVGHEAGGVVAKSWCAEAVLDQKLQYMNRERLQLDYSHEARSF